MRHDVAREEFGLLGFLNALALLHFSSRLILKLHRPLLGLFEHLNASTLPRSVYSADSSNPAASSHPQPKSFRMLMIRPLCRPDPGFVESIPHSTKPVSRTVPTYKSLPRSTPVLAVWRVGKLPSQVLDLQQVGCLPSGAKKLAIWPSRLTRRARGRWRPTPDGVAQGRAICPRIVHVRPGRDLRIPI
jgi:hypothetical protein